MAFYWLLCLFIYLFSHHISPTVQGEIEYVCVDIYKQPAFQHPSMKNHQIQMRPSVEFQAMLSMEPETSDMITSSKSEERCPKGQVPIHKPQSNYTNNFIHPETTITAANLHYAIIKTFDNSTERFGGAQAVFSIYKPRVLKNQFSKAWVWLNHREKDMISSIQFGWAVHTGLYRDDRPRLTTFSSDSGKHQNGCYNALCPGGYVQVHKTIYPGMVYDKVSVVGKKQHDVHLLVGQDSKTKSWLLMTRKTLIGYWPSHMYSMEGASQIYFGGYTGGPTGAISPPMGAGTFPREVNRIDNLASFMKQLKSFQDKSLVDINCHSFEEYVDSPKCYDVWYREFELGSGEMLTFGGPGGVCGMV